MPHLLQVMLWTHAVMAVTLCVVMSIHSVDLMQEALCFLVVQLSVHACVYAEAFSDQLAAVVVL